MESTLKIARETEFYQGYIRFKMSVTNDSTYVITDVTLDFNYDDDLLRIDRHEPNYNVKREKFLLGNIPAGNSKSIAIYFDPLMCSRGTDINCQVTYRDHEGNLNNTFMEPKEISVVCPIMKTDQDINIGRLKDLLSTLPSKDSRIYDIQSGFDMNKLANLACEVVQKHDVRHVRTLHTRDGSTCEIWHYGKTKVTQNAIVIKVSILARSHTIELFAATNSSEALTGLLAEVGRELKQVIESRASGKGSVVNVHIKDSVVQRSNLLDMCSTDGTCDINLVIEDSVVQHSGIITANENQKRRREQKNRQDRFEATRKPEPFNSRDEGSWEILHANMVTYVVGTLVAFAGMFLIVTIAPLFYGFVHMTVKGARSEPVSITDVFEGFRNGNFIRSWIFVFIYLVVVGIAGQIDSIFATIIGIIFIFGMPLLVIKGYSAFDALEGTIRIVKENPLRSLVLYVIIVILNVIGSMLLFVGLLITVPLSQIMLSKATIELAGDK